MYTSRRNFLKKSAITLAGTAVFTNELFAAVKSGHIVGVQLYSVRDDMQKDPLGTLKKVAGMGYKYVEHADYVNRKFYGNSPAEFKKVLDDLGLKMKSGHTVMGKQHWDAGKKDFTDAWKYTVEDAAVVGQEYVISPSLDASLRKTYDDLLRYMDVFNKSGELCKKSGMLFGYHNHDFEFNTTVNNMKLYDIIMKNTDPSLVIHQMDMGNMYGTGGRALELLKQYPGRYQSMHVKDEIKSNSGGEMGGYDSTILGKGVISVKEVIDMGKEIGGTKHFIIEQESYQGKPAIDCIKEDLEVMKKWGY